MDEQEKEIEEILRTFDKAPSPSSENSERTARTSNQTEYKRQAQSSKMDIWFENK
ncbi:MAG: hypothetical protein KH201_08455 [Clostridium sp.]|nr:hypothetical protein [Clostridium sp.]